VRGHDINGKRFYKQLNLVESVRGAAKPLIFVFPVENEFERDARKLTQLTDGLALRLN
jgi:hypothetical protein